MYKMFSMVFGAAVCVMLLTVLIINLVIDPYGLRKPLYYTSFDIEKIHKPIELLKNSYSTVIVGNSRNNYGLDPERLALPDVYNLSMAGAGIAEIDSLVTHALSLSSTKRLFISLDSVCDPQSARGAAYSIDKRFLLSNQTSYFSVIANMLALHISYDTLKRAWDTYSTGQTNLAVNKQGSRTFSFDGKTVGATLARREYLNLVGNGKPTVDKTYQEFKNGCSTKHFQNIVENVTAKNIEATYLINPHNARYWYIANLKNGLKYGKLYIKKIIQETIMELASDKDIKIKVYDFLRLNQYTLEPISSSATTQHGRYWYESSHYTRELGDKILNVLINDDVSDPHLVRVLNNLGIEQDYLSQVALLEHWQQQNQNLVEEILIAAKEIQDAD